MSHRSLLAAATALSLALLASASRAGDYTIDGSGSEHLGWSMCAVPDVNWDGVQEILIGAPNWNGGDGRVALYSGQDGAELWSQVGGIGYGLGWSVSLAGDMNNDGEQEYLVGAPTRPNGGRVWVMSETGSLVRTHSLVDHRLGAAVAPLDDVDGDGYDDYVCASDIDQFGLLTGRVVVYSGKTGSTLYALLGGQTTEYFGQAVCQLGDINGDGIKDFAVGSPKYNHGFPFSIIDAGLVTLVSGANGIRLKTISGITGPFDYLGCAVDSAGDYDGDGVDDIIAGAYGWDDNGAGGTAFVLSGANGGILKQFFGATPGEGFGSSVAGCGDINLNGQVDFMIGSPLHNNFTGQAQLISGSGVVLATRQGEQAGSRFGHAVLAHPDINRNGRGDWVTSAPWVNNRGAYFGRVYAEALCPTLNRNYGTGHPGTLGEPTLMMDADPIYGAPLSLQVGNARGQTTVAILLVGLSPMNVPTNKDGVLRVNFDFTLVFSMGPGGKSIPSTLAHPGICYPSIYYQALQVDPGASKGMAFSPGLEVLFGTLTSQ